jgi:hypothetical protein
VAFKHVLLTVLDLATVPAFLLLVVTVYRLPKTLRKLGGYENVWNRTGRHWSTLTLRANMRASGSGKSRASRANYYILKRAAKLFSDVAIAVLLCISALVPWKLPCVLADLRLILWYKTPEQNATETGGDSPQPGILNTHAALNELLNGPDADPPAVHTSRPGGSILDTRTSEHRERRQAAGKLLIQMYAPWCIAVVIGSIWVITTYSAVMMSLFPDWCQDFEDSIVQDGSGSAIGLFDAAQPTLEVHCIWLPSGLLLLTCCCCCCGCYFTDYRGSDCKGSVDSCCPLLLTVEQVATMQDCLRDGMSKRTRYQTLQRLTLCHFLLLPLDVIVEPVFVASLLVLKLTRWRYPPLKRQAKDAIKVSGWCHQRGQRYKYVTWHMIQWLLDFPAVLVLLVLIFTVWRAKAVVLDLLYFQNPDRSSKARQHYIRSQAAYRQLQNGVAAITNDTEPCLRNTKFDRDLSPALARSQRRLAIAKLLHMRLTDEIDDEIPFFPLEVVQSIAECAVPVFRVPNDWPLAEEAVRAAPPDATFLLDPGVHRVPFERLGYGRGMAVEGTGASPSDVIVVPILDRHSFSAETMTRRAQAVVNSCPAGVLKNVTVVFEPAVVRQRSFAQEEGVSEWRQLVWRNAVLLVLDLPYPALALLCLWRLPQLITRLRSPNEVYDRHSRMVLTLQLLVKVLLDVPASIAVLLMVFSGWRIPSLRRARQNHIPTQSPYKTVWSEFIQWICDVPFAVFCLCMLPFVWRTPRLLSTLWKVGHGIGSDRTSVWYNVITPLQRLLIVRCVALCLLDLLCIASAPLLVLCPWRGAQAFALAKYERMHDMMHGKDARQFRTNSDHDAPATPLRDLFGYETDIIAKKLRVAAVQIGAGGARSHVVVRQQDVRSSAAVDEPSAEVPTTSQQSSVLDGERHPDVDSEQALSPAPYDTRDADVGDAALLEPQVQANGVATSEALTFSSLHCAYMAAADLWRFVEFVLILPLGFRHLPYLVCGLISTVGEFRAGNFTQSYMSCDFIDDDVKLCNLLCCLPCILCYFCKVDHRYLGVIEQCSYTGNVRRQPQPLLQQPQQNAPVALFYQYAGQNVLLVSPSLSMTMFHPIIDKTFAKAMWDMPHLVLVPVKLLVVLLVPSYFYLQWRYKPTEVRRGSADALPAVTSEEWVPQTVPPILSIFLHPLRQVVERKSTGISFWNAHEAGLVFLLITPLCILDMLALIYMLVTVTLFAWPLTLAGPLWNSSRVTAGFERLGGLLPQGLASRKLHLVQTIMIVLQVIATPVLLLWVLFSICSPMLVEMLLYGQPLGSGWSPVSASVARIGAHEWPTLVLWLFTELCWICVVVGGCILSHAYCGRHFPLFAPPRACHLAVERLLQGRLLKLYQVLLVKPTVWLGGCHPSEGRRKIDSS